jgi:hypothetical protein
VGDYFAGLPSCASAYSRSCLTPRASAGARAQNSRRAWQVDYSQGGGVNLSGLNAVLQGPVVGIGLRF